MKEKKEKQRNGKRTALIVLCVVLAVILVLLITATAFVEHKLGLINKATDPGTMSSSEYEEFLKNQETETVDPEFSGVTIHGDVEWNHGEGLIEDSDQVLNILLIGQDRRSGQGRSRSDAMILCTIDKTTKSVTMTSFMRDMYVPIPGYQDNRINTCYALGGMELLDACLEKNFGIQVDGNIEVDFFAFMDIIDMLGGVDITLTQAEANYLNRRGNWDISNDHWNLVAGVNTLNGSQALAYSRIREIGDDFGRTERQRTVLSAVAEKCKGLSLSELNKLLNKILPMITTDMSSSQIMNYALELFPMLSGMTIDTLRIPADGTYQNAWVRGMAVLVPDLEANRQILIDNLSN